MTCGSPLPIMPAEAMVRQAEVDAAYLAVEATRADPIYQAELQAKATAARERAHRLRAAMARTIPCNNAARSRSTLVSSRGARSTIARAFGG